MSDALTADQHGGSIPPRDSPKRVADNLRWLAGHLDEPAFDMADCARWLRRAADMLDSHVETAAEPADELGWLIEFTPWPEPLYFIGGNNDQPNFDKDPNKAVRFSRQQDGEAVLDYLVTTYQWDEERRRYYGKAISRSCYKVTEHMWCAPRPAVNGREDSGCKYILEAIDRAEAAEADDVVVAWECASCHFLTPDGEAKCGCCDRPRGSPPHAEGPPDTRTGDPA